MKISIIQTGVANTASIVAAFDRLGYEAEFCESAEHVRSADAVVLPGVGAFAAGMSALQDQGLVDALHSRIREDAPTLAVCLGFQLLCAASEEGPGVRGLAVFERTAQRFPTGLRVPQLGWNWIEADAGCNLLSSDYVYFANSYRIEQRLPAPWSCAMANYGGEFVAAAERGRILGCQFHPELSGEFGQGLLSRWLIKEAK